MSNPDHMDTIFAARRARRSEIDAGSAVRPIAARVGDRMQIVSDRTVDGVGGAKITRNEVGIVVSVQDAVMAIASDTGHGRDGSCVVEFARARATVNAADLECGAYKIL